MGGHDLGLELLDGREQLVERLGRPDELDLVRGLQERRRTLSDEEGLKEDHGKHHVRIVQGGRGAQGGARTRGGSPRAGGEDPRDRQGGARGGQRPRPGGVRALLDSTRTSRWSAWPRTPPTLLQAAEAHTPDVVAWTIKMA